jgi:poly(3-hydroxybutyrate) depolymerase
MSRSCICLAMAFQLACSAPAPITAGVRCGTGLADAASEEPDTPASYLRFHRAMGR